MRDVPINQEIRGYTEKVVLNIFDIRQSISIIACLGIAAAGYFFIPKSLIIIRYIAIIIGVIIPGTIGFYSYNRLTGEHVLEMLFKYYFVNPKKYTCITKHEQYDQLETVVNKQFFKDVKKEKAQHVKDSENAE